jgi:hypothetical protein
MNDGIVLMSFILLAYRSLFLHLTWASVMQPHRQKDGPFRREVSLNTIVSLYIPKSDLFMTKSSVGVGVSGLTLVSVAILLNRLQELKHIFRHHVNWWKR